jgi:hypothetical protein
MTNKKTVFSLLLAFFISIFLLNVPSAFSQVNEKSILWQISGNGLKQPSYLFGTVHILDSSNYFLHKNVIEKIESSEIMVFEINTNDPDYQKKALQYSFMSDDSLENIFTEEEYHKLELFFEDEFSFPLQAVHKMKPFYLSSVINALSMPENTMSYEAELKNIAIKNGLEISGISTLEKENEILKKMDMDVQIYTLDQAIEEHKTGYKQREQIVLLYTKNDIHAIYELMMKEDSPEDNIVYDILFPKRHEVWIPNMIKMMNEKSCFFAVGVGHLPGEAGLLNILSDKGYKVKSVSMDFKLHDE